MTMTTEEIKSMIEEVGIAYAYEAFEHDDEEETAPPYLIFSYGDTHPFTADNRNYVNIVRLRIELITDQKDFELEKKIQSILSAHDLIYVKDSAYVSAEEVNSTVYEMGLILK